MILSKQNDSPKILEAITQKMHIQRSIFASLLFSVLISPSHLVPWDLAMRVYCFAMRVLISKWVLLYHIFPDILISPLIRVNTLWSCTLEEYFQSINRQNIWRVMAINAVFSFCSIKNISIISCKSFNSHIRDFSVLLLFLKPRLLP